MSGECAFGMEISEDRSRCAIAKAWREAPGRMAGKGVWHGPPPVAPTVMDALYLAGDPGEGALGPKAQSPTPCHLPGGPGIIVKRAPPEGVPGSPRRVLRSPAPG